MRSKILFVINSLAGGGAERVFSTILHGSAAYRRDHEVTAVLLDREAEAYTLPDWLPVHRLDCRGSLARSLAGLASVVRRERPDVALSFLTRANVATAAAMSAARRPFIVSERVNTTAHLGGGLRGLASKVPVRMAYPRASAVIAVSQGVADTLVADFAVGADRIAVIANPVDLDRIGEAARAEPEFSVTGPYVAAMGRLAPNKNLALAIRAFAESGLDGRLVVMGQGPEEGALRRLGDELGLGDRLLLPGFVANPYAILSRARFFALPSNAEGFPNALVEAMACGVPVVATDCRSGPAEVLEVGPRASGTGPIEGAGGLLVPVDNAPVMAEAFRRMTDSGLVARLAAAGLRRVASFGVERAVSRYWSVIDDVLKARRS
jgi:N-acetylgalactosamine-N,N'-diacetylbacillosaminyl-diphospho-undecaprenol 4-alpha-N-acetylgalactosaminyltransferase